MPLYTYVCDDCGAELEILHGLGKARTACGLDCQRQGPGAFGQGVVRPVLSPANISAGHKAAANSGMPSFGDVHREAMRQKALRRLGGELNEGDLDKLRDKGIAVFRKDGKGWTRDGGGIGSTPVKIKPPDDS